VDNSVKEKINQVLLPDILVNIVGPLKPTQIVPVHWKVDLRGVVVLNTVLEETTNAREKWNCLKISLLKIEGNTNLLETL
jgi:hypothetical protein